MTTTTHEIYRHLAAAEARYHPTEGPPEKLSLAASAAHDGRRGDARRYLHELEPDDTISGPEVDAWRAMTRR